MGGGWGQSGGGGVGLIVGGSSTSKNALHTINHMYKSPKQFEVKQS